MGLTRNRAFACQLALLAGALAVFAAAAAAVEGPRAGLWVLAAGALACALFATFSLRRYRQIARLASEVDEVLHGGRRIAFSDYREGDLAVLRNELAKMVAALRTATERLDAEKNALADALAPLAGAFDLRDVACETHVDEGASFNGDAAWSAEALGNILKNCMEHTPAGGCVRVQASEDAVAFRLSVADTGPGIAAEDLPRLFERFYRGAGSEGFGIGLALAQALVTAQGGTLRAGNDRETGGARFDLTFPKVVV